ncbi:MAG: hypothetical protein RMJ31_02150 [Nitrososphaerota archaeon]|nr:hypothetical protein [Nitrososphaerota archaeon]
MDKILREIMIDLEEDEKRELYIELAKHFALIGSYGDCERLDELWNDPIYRRVIEDYIRAWVNFRKKRMVVEAYA